MRTARKVASVVVLGDLVWFASLRLASSLLTPAAWVLTPPVVTGRILRTPG